MKKLIGLFVLLGLMSCADGTRREVVNSRYVVVVPEEMKPVASLHENASLQQMSAENELYLVVIDESKEEMKKHELDYDLPLYFTNIVSRQFIEKVHEVSISEPVKKEINSLPALVSTITGKADSTEIFYKVAVIESPTHFYQLLTWTTGSRRATNEPSMEAMVNSFSEVK